MQKITPMLWFDGTRKKPSSFTCPSSKTGKSTPRRGFRRARRETTSPARSMTIAFELKGQQFVALNGGPGFPFTNAVSLVVNCDS